MGGCSTVTRELARRKGENQAARRARRSLVWSLQPGPTTTTRSRPMHGIAQSFTNQSAHMRSTVTRELAHRNGEKSATARQGCPRARDALGASVDSAFAVRSSHCVDKSTGETFGGPVVHLTPSVRRADVESFVNTLVKFNGHGSTVARAQASRNGEKLVARHQRTVLGTVAAQHAKRADAPRRGRLRRNENDHAPGAALVRPAAVVDGIDEFCPSA